MGLILGALQPALQLWLRSQLDAIEHLQIQLQGGDRQLLQGLIPQVALEASSAVYQGLHLGEVRLGATDISLQWRPSVQLRAPLAADLQVTLSQTDLAASLESPLLDSGITDLLARTLGEIPWGDRSVAWTAIALQDGAIVLTGTLDGEPVDLSFGLAVGDHALDIGPLQLSWGDRYWEAATTAFDLGDASISELAITSDRCCLCGQLTIHPAVTVAEPQLDPASR